MPEPYTWGTLAKGIGDPTTIDQEIDTKMAAHNAELSAHGQTSEALYTHRVAELLDHLDESIKNVKMKYPIRAFNAVVDAGGGGDYTTIQAAIDFVHGEGGGRILVTRDTYVMASNITLYENTELIGEDPDNTIIDFNNTTYNMRADSGGAADLANIRIANLQINRCRNTTEGVLYLDGVRDSTIENCYFNNNITALNNGGISANLFNTTRVHVINCRFNNFYRAIKLGETEESNIAFNYASGGYEAFIGGEYLVRCSIIGNTVYNGGTYFIVNENAFEDCDISHNASFAGKPCRMYLGDFSWSTLSDNHLERASGAGAGIDVSGDRVRVCQNFVSGFSTRGIDAYTDRSIYDSNICVSNGTYGLRIADSGCQYNIVTSNQLAGNSSTSLVDNGTGTVKANNVTA